MVGKRFTGKSTTSVALASMFKHVSRWTAWCGTKDTEDYWSKKFESSASVWGADDDGMSALKRVIAFQQDKVLLYQRVLKRPVPESYTVGMIFDDVTSSRLFRSSEVLEDLFANGRHYRVVIIISCQYPKQLPPVIRTNTDYLFMMHNTKRTCRILHEEFVEQPDDFGTFMEITRAVTGQKTSDGVPMFNSLVFNNCTKTLRLDEMFQVFRHTADFDPHTVTLGSEAWRAYNRVHFVDTDERKARDAYDRRHPTTAYDRCRPGQTTAYDVSPDQVLRIHTRNRTVPTTVVQIRRGFKAVHPDKDKDGDRRRDRYRRCRQ